jgi:hypothetical protein
MIVLYNSFDFSSCFCDYDAINTISLQEIENEKHLQELAQVMRIFLHPIHEFVLKTAIKLFVTKAVVELPAMDDRGKVTQVQADSFFDHNCPAVRSLRLAVGAQVRKLFDMLCNCIHFTRPQHPVARSLTVSSQGYARSQR